MKTFFKLSLVATLCCLLITSCDENYKIEEEDNPKEALMSETGDRDIASLSSDGEEIQSEVLYHKSFDAELSMEEADALWKKEMINLKVPSLKNAKSTEWFHWVRTRTGSQTHNGTNSRVDVWIYYKTDIGHYRARRKLNNPGDDRRRGKWDYYLLRSSISGKAVKWVELKKAYLGLKGTDGWFVTRFYVCLLKSKQSIPAKGGSHIHSKPYVWLDNSKSSGWDYYGTGNIGYGRLTF